MGAKGVETTSVSALPFIFDDNTTRLTESLLNSYYNQIEKIDINCNKTKLTDYFHRKVLEVCYEIFYSLKREPTISKPLGKMIVSGKGAPFLLQLIEVILRKQIKIRYSTQDVRVNTHLAFLPKELRESHFVPSGYGVVEIAMDAYREISFQDASIASRIKPPTEIPIVDLLKIIPEQKAWDDFAQIIKNRMKPNPLCPFIGEFLFLGYVIWDDIQVYSVMSSESKKQMGFKLDTSVLTEQIFHAVLYVIVRKDSSLLCKLSLVELLKGRQFLAKYYFIEALETLDTVIFLTSCKSDLPYEIFKDNLLLLTSPVNCHLSLAYTILRNILRLIENNMYSRAEKVRFQVDAYFNKLLYFTLSSNVPWFAEKKLLATACVDLVRCCPRLGKLLIPFAKVDLDGSSFMNFVESHAKETDDIILLHILNKYQSSTLPGLLFQEKAEKEYIPTLITNLEEMKLKVTDETKRRITLRAEGDGSHIIEALYTKYSSNRRVLEDIEARIKKELLEKNRAQYEEEIKQELRLAYEAKMVTISKSDGWLKHTIPEYSKPKTEATAQNIPDEDLEGFILT
ncbi:MAG: hypothetical protein WC222_12240 [Parachlamydiales bacterium]|jgi:hypothetical protein